MNVVLIGYRGTGKSSISEQVGAALGLEVLSLDRQIASEAGMSIPEIVAARGWPGFRDLEEDVCRRAAARGGRVIDCGGGVIERPANSEVLRASGLVFWLKARVETIVSRISGDASRPSLTESRSFTDEVAEVLERRTPLYRALAHHEIETDGRAVGDLATEIVERFRRSPSP